MTTASMARLYGTRWPSVSRTAEGEPFQLAWPTLAKALAKPRPVRGRKTDQPIWTFGRFCDHYRDTDHHEASCALVLDYDACRELTPSLIHETWGSVRYLAHTSWSHGPEMPKWRVILPLDRDVSAEEHAVLMTAAGRKLGGLDARPVAQGYFVPLARDGYTHCSNPDGRPLAVDDALKTECERQAIEAASRPVHEPREAPTAESNARKYAMAALEGECREVAAMARGTGQPGGRHLRLFLAAKSMGSLEASCGLSRGFVESAVSDAAAACGLLDDEGDHGIRRTIGDGYAAGLAEPRVPDAGDSGCGTSSSGQSPDWDPLRPLPPTRPPVPTLSPDLLPPPLRPWLVDEAERAALLLEMVAAPALVSLSSVVGRAIGMRPGRCDDWTTALNLWGGVVALSGSMKSHTIGVGLAPVRPLEEEARQQHEQERHHAEARREAIEAQIKVVKKPGQGALVDVDELARLKEEAEQARAVERRFTTSDATPEKLGVLAADNPRGLLNIRDELTGWLADMERPGREGTRAFFIEGWEGTRPFTVDRIGRGKVFIPALCLSVLGSIQPGPLGRLVDEAIKGAEGADGLLQRFQVLIWPDKMPPWRRSDRSPDETAREQAYAVYRRLAEMPASDEGLAFVRFDDKAQNRWDGWRDDLENRLRSGGLDDTPAFRSHLAKYRSFVPSLALLDHLCVCAASEPVSAVSLPSLERAIGLAAFFEAHAQKVYAAEMDPTAQAVHRLADKLLEGSVRSGDTRRDLARPNWKGLDRAAIATALPMLEDLGWLRLIPKAPGPKGGRPSEAILVRPGLRKAVEAMESTDKTDETPAESPDGEVLSVSSVEVEGSPRKSAPPDPPWAAEWECPR